MPTKDLARPKSDVRHVLARILDQPTLVADVRALPPTALAKLIEHVGLEDSGEIVALATTEQLEQVFDEDLWTRDVPGADEVFDSHRFVVWLEILLEAGVGVAAHRLAELDKDVVTLAFHRLVVVIDIESLAAEIAEGMHEDGVEIEQALDGALSHEIGSYMVIARQHDGWDAIVQALVGLDELDPSMCGRLAAMTEREAADEGGLSEVLTAEESLSDDVSGDRDDRRARAGFVAPADARAFLRLAKEHVVEGVDPITKAYFRDLDREAPPPEPRLMSWLRDAGVLKEPKNKPRALGSKERILALAIEKLSPALRAERMEELAFLVNVLLAGDKRHWRPAEAAEAVVAVAEHGAKVLGRGPEKGIVALFQAGVREGKLDDIARDRR